MPDIKEIHQDQVLTNIALGYAPQGYIADKIMPRVSVPKKSDKYYVFGKEQFQTPDTIWPTKTAPNAVDYALSTDTFYCIDRALRHGIDDRERDNADAPLNLEREGTELLTEQLMLAREIRVADIVLASASSAQETTLAGNYQWNSGHASSVPITDIRTGIRTIRDAIGRAPNTILMSKAVKDVLEDHSTILDRMKYTNPLYTIEDWLRQQFGFTQVLIGEAMYETANPAQTSSLANVWTDSVCIAYVAPRPGVKTRSFGYQMVWSDLKVWRAREDTINTTWIMAGESVDEKVAATDCLYQIHDTLA
jgi:hypothetical protein